MICHDSNEISIARLKNLSSLEGAIVVTQMQLDGNEKGID